MNDYDVLIIGGGPIGLACGIEAGKRGYSHVILERGCLCNAIYQYPTSMRFFSTPELLELGGVPFITQSEKPTRQEALTYYRRVARAFELNTRLYESVETIEGEDGAFEVTTSKRTYRTRKVIVAIGFFSEPRMLGVPGEERPKVSHFYKEAHLYADQRLLVIGSGNSAVDAALECWRAGAHVTMAVRGDRFHDGIKYWLLPDIQNRIEAGEINAYFQTQLAEVREESVVLAPREGEPFEIDNDFVLALTGYLPDFGFLRRIGIALGDDANRTPAHDPQTYETNRQGVYLAGVVAGGMRTNTWFIENSRAHAVAILRDIDARATATKGSR